MARLTLGFICVYLFIVPILAESLNDILFSGDYEFVDLTYPFDSETVYWPDGQNFRYTKTFENYTGGDKSWYAAYEFAAAEHGGTHLDAPYHFFKSGIRVGEIPLDRLIVPLIIADISSKVNSPDFVLHKHDLDYVLNTNNGRPCVIIFKFGWSKYFYDRKKYLGLDEHTNALNFPGLSAEVAEWITSHKNVVGVGVDVASVDPGSSTDFPVHKIFSRAGLYSIENVNMDQPLSDHKCVALALPMKLAAGTGAPLRLVALCPKGAPHRAHS